jgi:signal transduction histidine kinase
LASHVLTKPFVASHRVPESHDDFADRLRDAKLSALAEFAAGAGHEINNPVATILGRAQQLLQQETDPARQRALATIASQALRIRDMIGDLMLFARPPDPEPGWHDLSRIVDAAASPLLDVANERGIALESNATHAATAFVDPLQMTVAVSALIENALNATSNGGRIVVTVAEQDATREIRVEDDGIGFTPTDLEHAFDPFFSGRQAGRGLGFGLPKAWRIVNAAGGKIDIDSQPGRTVVSLRLPAPKPVGRPSATSNRPRRKRS